MSWFNKNKKESEDIEFSGLPELPESNDMNFPSQKELPDVPGGLPEIETNPLPELPEQKTIKPEIPAIPEQEFQKSQFAPLKPPILNEPTTKIQEPKTVEIPQNIYSPKQSIKKAEPIFIRLDKFENAVETFDEVREKINEIEELLKKTREIKIKEEQELEEWEKEIQIIKSRIEAVDKNIFNKLD